MLVPLSIDNSVSFQYNGSEYDSGRKFKYSYRSGAGRYVINPFVVGSVVVTGVVDIVVDEDVVDIDMTLDAETCFESLLYLW
jgi:hypothetical protein